MFDHLKIHFALEIVFHLLAFSVPIEPATYLVCIVKTLLQLHHEYTVDYYSSVFLIVSKGPVSPVVAVAFFFFLRSLEDHRPGMLV